MNIKQLQEERAAFISEQRSLLESAKADNNRDLTAEETEKFDSLQDKVSKHTKNITRLEALEEAESRYANIVEEAATVNATDFETAKERIEGSFRNYFLTGIMTADDAAFIAGFSPNKLEQRAQSKTAAAGGYTVPEGFSNELAKAEKYFCNLYDFARVIRTDSGNDLPWPKTNDTSNKAYLLTEGSDATSSSTDVTFGVETLKAYKYASGFIAVSRELLEDSAFDMEALLIDLFAERMGRGVNYAFTLGTGSSQPQGAAYGASTGLSVSGVGLANITYDNLVALKMAVDPAYRMKGAWMLSDEVLKTIMKLKDGSGAYIFQPSLDAATPATLFGQPIILNNDMAAVSGSPLAYTAGDKPIVYGDFSKFVIRQVNGDHIKVDHSIYAKTDQIGIGMFRRIDSRIIDGGGGALKAIVQA